ncbi:inactive protein RESTRICTED TEV MOVEMENT 2-like [Juglans microcarpa x Juglans regia]|uniref:inactive protein RESTRICTED TEV MOVEMENT 2-like n=1 Tax=Juglans microcarpa x Juglans regia TaxID=2249226 RepID=UPI001B7F6F71|nr:inactive protein RESTRICTED TEV MOVEMENT 2-like [Juglans microcarpa x Juglans regia]
MDAKPRAVDRVYEDFEPKMEWAREERSDTLIVLLPGFSKEQLRVQVTSSRDLRVSGERPLGNNKWRRFNKELSIPSDVETNKITAKFEGGTLYIIHPKAITPAKPQDDAKLPAKSQENFKSETQFAQKSDQGQAAQEVPSKATSDKRTKGKPAAQATVYTTRSKTSKKEEANDTTGKTSVAAPANSVPQNVPEKEKEPRSTDGKSNTVEDANMTSGKKPEKEEPIYSEKKKSTAVDSETKNGGLEETKNVSNAGSDKKNESTLGDSIENAAKMDKGSISSGKSSMENYKQVAKRLVLEVKQPKKLINFVVAALLALVLVLYLKKATKPLEGSKSQF